MTKDTKDAILGMACLVAAIVVTWAIALTLIALETT